MPKFKERDSKILNNDLYFDVLENKGVKSLFIRPTVTFKTLRGHEFGIMSEHIWQYSDNLIKLSFQYYGDSQYWWVIGLLNNKPTDVHYSIGDVIYIPSTPYQVAELMK